MSKATLEKKFGHLRIEYSGKKSLLRLLDSRGAVLMVAVRRVGEKDTVLETRLWKDADVRYANVAEARRC